MTDMEPWEIVRENSERLTDRIMAKLGELFLNKEVQQKGQFDFNTTQPREEIRSTVAIWLEEEERGGS